MTARRVVGRIFLIGVGFFFVFLSIKLLLGFAYCWTSKEDIFVCQDLFCLRPGVSHPYQIVGRRDGEDIVSLYSCDLHNLANYERLNPFDRPTPISFLMASSLIFIPILLVIARFRRAAHNPRLVRPAVELSSQESQSQPSIFATLDKMADQAGGSLRLSFRRFFVNGICLAVLITSVAIVPDMNLPRVGNMTLAIVAICASAALLCISTAIEKEYPEVAELREEFSTITWRLFIKRFVNWGVLIYGVAGIGYLVIIVFEIKV